MRELSFEELEKQIREAPKTWIPALVCIVIQTACRNKVFKPDGLLRVVKKVHDSEEGISNGTQNQPG